jgi:arginyl-tRNA synthetase
MEEVVRPEHEARKKAREDGQDPSILENQGLLAERDAYSKQMENGEPESMTLWKKFRDVSIEYYQEAYTRLNIKFDEYAGESQVSLNSEAITEVVSVLKDRDVYEERDGAWVIDFDKYGEKKDKHGEKKLGTVPLRDRNGSTTYLLPDITTVFDRLKTYSFDKMVYVVGEQEGHFRKLIKAVELMGRADVGNKLQHVSFARADGRPAAFGNARLLGDILDQCEKHMHDAVVASPDDNQIENCEAVSRAMGINSLVLQELASKKRHNGLDSVRRRDRDRPATLLREALLKTRKRSGAPQSERNSPH